MIQIIVSLQPFLVVKNNFNTDDQLIIQSSSS